MYYASINSHCAEMMRRTHYGIPNLLEKDHLLSIVGSMRTEGQKCPLCELIWSVLPINASPMSFMPVILVFGMKRDRFYIENKEYGKEYGKIVSCITATNDRLFDEIAVY